MVCIATMEAQREHFNKNLARYKREHPGEWLFLDESLRATFYKTEEEFNNSLKPYKNSFGATFLATRIPLDKKRAEYNLEIRLDIDLNGLAKSIGVFEAAEFVLKAKPYEGNFIVHNNGYLSRGHTEGLEKRVAVLRLTEPSNFEIINRKENKPVHAHLETGERIISYTPKQIKNGSYKTRL